MDDDDRYAPAQPSLQKSTPFELTSFFEGSTRAWGIFEDRFGRVRRRLMVDLHGRWEREQFVLDELFTYDTGETETRTWRVVPTGPGRFVATTADCVGAAQGRCDADSVHMAYSFRLKLDGRDLVVTFDDRLYRVSDTLAVNRARVSKWGFKLGEVSLSFERLDASATSARLAVKARELAA